MYQLKPFAWFAIIAILSLSLSRAGLIIWQWDRVPSGFQLVTLMVNGVRMDFVVLCQILLIPTFLVLVLPVRLLETTFFRRLVDGWFTGWLTFLLFMEVVTPAYIEFFDTRPGRIFFEYLDRPVEIFGLIRGMYALDAVLAVALPPLITLLVFKKISSADVSFNLSYLRRLATTIPLVLILLLGSRSSLGHRPINPSFVAISNDQLVNDLALSSGYKLLYAIYSLRHEDSPGDYYGEMDQATVMATTRADSFWGPDTYTNQTTTHHRFGNTAMPRKNIVIVVEESLGARFVGKLGGKPLTPELDKLSNEGIWFTNLYATGVRSARGLQAIATGFPPSPSRSVLKLGKSQQNFYTIASTLGDLGYTNYFMYGGEAYYDNMQQFFLNNGFTDVIDINDFTDDTFKGTWGVSDEDLFTRADTVLSDQDEPFFALIFSSSFHSPYEFPDDRIELVEEPKASKHNAVKYADYSLGEFFQKAKKSSYWENTIFLIVADHDERLRGGSLVPIICYHIPGLILGKDIAPQVYTQVASQIDLAPTVLTLAGIHGVAPFMGNNLLDVPETDTGRAIMQFGNNHAYMKGNQVVIHRPDLPASQFTYVNGELRQMQLDPALEQLALAWATLPGMLYDQRLYRPVEVSHLSSNADQRAIFTPLVSLPANDFSK